MLSAFLDYLTGSSNAGKLSSLKQVIASGEALLPAHVERFNELFNENGTVLANLYGPTEATIDVSYYNCWEKDPRGIIPIGKPIDNISLYIIDQYRHLQPIGIPGQLCIAGTGLARGYLNRPGLTADKFINIHHPSFIIPHSKLYLTGDLARWLADGNIEFLGRIDHQVKIRGYRIELGEIENALSGHPDIKEAVVTAGNNALCAYIVCRTKLGPAELSEYLAKQMPDYMIPAYFVNLEKIPLTSNGKVDRRSLPVPGGDGPDETGAYIPPRNEIEKTLVNIWQKVLGREKVGINQDFFAIGGDSIKSIQIISRMGSAGYKIEMKDIFRYPVIANLAPRVKKLKRIPEQSVITGSISLIPIQEAFFNEFRHDFHHYNQAVMLDAQEGFDRKILELVFTRIQEHHDALRSTFHRDMNGGKFVQIIHGLEYPLSLQEFDLKNNKNLQEFNTKVNEIQAGIDLEKGPLMKVGLFHLNDGDRLLIVIHHLVVDGVSWRILFEDIEALYREYKKGKSPVLPLKTDSFKVWSEKLCAYANSDSFLTEKNEWMQLESQTVPPIKKDFENQDIYMKDFETVSFSLAKTASRQLLTKVNEAFGTGIDDILLTAFGLAIKKTFGNERILIAMEGHGREGIIDDIDVSRTIGWFTALYPVWLDFSYGYREHECANNLSRQIKEVKESLHRITNKGIGYGILEYLTKKELKKDIHFRLHPQIMFNYLGQFDEDLKNRFFKIAKEPVGYCIAKNARRQVELDVSGSIIHECLSLSVSYSSKQYKKETITGLLKHFKDELNFIITYCAKKETRELTPGDLTYPVISIDAFDQLQKQYSYLIADIYTLTPMQEGMLFYALYENKDRTTYFEQISYRLHGELNAALVEKSVNELFKRHDVLRTLFIYEGLNQPLQVVLKERQVEFLFKDIREDAANSENKENWVARFRHNDRQRAFNLSKDVLMRMAVLRLDDAEYQVTWSFHHILMDGWCIGI
ncbi:MAG TPA: condensation domain-containing protein, partial [Candidatus Kapabacteria bacterium]|nr:condensation domain-containing protein [Candidatus Kapabacteria bacterium]